MVGYHIFCMQDGQIVSRHDFTADDDIEATALARLKNPHTDCELWCGTRLVAFLLEADGPAPQAP